MTDTPSELATTTTTAISADEARALELGDLQAQAQQLQAQGEAYREKDPHLAQLLDALATGPQAGQQFAIAILDVRRRIAEHQPQQAAAVQHVAAGAPVPTVHHVSQQPQPNVASAGVHVQHLGVQMPATATGSAGVSVQHLGLSTSARTAHVGQLLEQAARDGQTFDALVEAVVMRVNEHYTRQLEEARTQWLEEARTQWDQR